MTNIQNPTLSTQMKYVTFPGVYGNSVDKIFYKVPFIYNIPAYYRYPNLPTKLSELIDLLGPERISIEYYARAIGSIPSDNCQGRRALQAGCSHDEPGTNDNREFIRYEPIASTNNGKLTYDPDKWVSIASTLASKPFNYIITEGVSNIGNDSDCS